MPVIINDFQIEAAPPTPATPAPPADKKGGATPPRPADIIRIQEWHQQRMARLQAD